ncbi:hypothetical protein Tco_1458620 [Tanacetum coccineum]
MAQLKKLTFEELKVEFEKLMRSIESFVPMGSEERVKRAGVQLEQESSKKQKIAVEDVPVTEEKVEVVKKEEPIKRIEKRKKQKARKGTHADKTVKHEAEEDMEALVKGNEIDSSLGTDIPVSAVPVAIKPLSIANWKIIKLGNKGFSVAASMFGYLEAAMELKGNIKESATSIANGFEKISNKPLMAEQFRHKNWIQHNLSKGNIIKIFYHGLNETTQEVLNAAAGGIFLYKTPNQAYQLLEDKGLLKLDWAKNQKSKPPLTRTIAFTGEGHSNSNTDKIIARMDAMTMKMDAQYKELQS